MNNPKDGPMLRQRDGHKDGQTDVQTNAKHIGKTYEYRWKHMYREDNEQMNGQKVWTI